VFTVVAKKGATINAMASHPRAGTVNSKIILI
jgi:hypothetical protein